MRSPSARVLINCVDIYRAVSGPDADGGPQYVYPPAPSLAQQSCSVQYVDTGEEVDELDRVSKVNWYHLIFVNNPHTRPRDKIVWNEQGAIHTMFVESNPPSEAGRGSAFFVRTKEYR